MEKDIFIKDEGDFVTVGFQSEKAKDAFIVEQHKNGDVFQTQHGSEELPKLDVAIEQQAVVEQWCEDNNLTFEYC